MGALEMIRDHCKEESDCENCCLYERHNNKNPAIDNCLVGSMPLYWDTEKIVEKIEKRRKEKLGWYK